MDHSDPKGPGGHCPPSKVAKKQAFFCQQKQIEFANIANRLLEEKSEKFTAQNQRQLQDTLQPLRTKIQEFEQGIAQKFLDEAKDKSALKEQIKQLAELNQQLSTDATNLASALKGGSKTQGDWGELQLETLLQKAGLELSLIHI